MNEIYLVDAAFLAKRPIRSLPEFHGARWSAWLRHACQLCQLPLDALIRGILPLRCGQKPIVTAEVIWLRLLARDPGRLGLLGEALGHTACHGAFSPKSLELLFWQDVTGCRKHPPDGGPAGMAPFSLDALGEAISLLAELETFSVQLHTPLRLPLPPGSKGKDAAVRRYCPPEFFSSGGAIRHLAERVRFWQFAGAALAATDLEITDNELVWSDMRYNQARQIALGGVTGVIRCKGRPGRALAERLVLGQYLGAGKNPLFGLGYWAIPELARQAILRARSDF